MDGFKFISPFNCIVCGGSQAGKTTFVDELLGNQSLFDKRPTEIIWCRGISTDAKDRGGVKYVDGLPDLDQLELICADRACRLLVIDDCLLELVENKALLPKIFTKYSHHLNLSVIVLTQSLFDISRICRLSAHYLVLFRNLSDQLNVEIVARQIFGKDLKAFMASYNDATSLQFGYILINNHPRENNRNYRLLTDIFTIPKVYLPK